MDNHINNIVDIDINKKFFIPISIKNDIVSDGHIEDTTFNGSVDTLIKDKYQKLTKSSIISKCNSIDNQITKIDNELQSLSEKHKSFIKKTSKKSLGFKPRVFSNVFDKSFNHLENELNNEFNKLQYKLNDNNFQKEVSIEEINNRYQTIINENKHELISYINKRLNDIDNTLSSSEDLISLYEINNLNNAINETIKEINSA